MKKNFVNGLAIGVNNIGDPFILKDVGTDGQTIYYLYATSFIKGFKVWSSKNLTDWKEEGICYDGSKSKWAKDSFWAPECTKYKGNYYLFFSANWNYNPENDDETFRIGLAMSDSPLGPFQDVSDHPIFDPAYPIIDANVFIDEDGRKYLTYSRCCYKHKVGPYEESHIYGVELSEDLTSTVGQPVKLLWPQQEWENQSLHTGRRWNEGSFMFKRNGTYYMTFSANHFMDKEYAIGYARADHPLGPYIKSEDNPLLAHDYPRMSGPGHNSLTFDQDGDEMLIVYHCHSDPVKGGSDRQVVIQSLIFDQEGNMEVL